MQKTRLCKTTVEQNDSGEAPVVQVQYLSQVKNAVNASQYGVHCSPELDTPCLLVTINNDPANSYVLPLSFLERKSIATKLKKGEIIVGNFKKNSTVLFNESGDISVSTENDITVNAAKDVNITASGNMTANIVGTTTLNGIDNVSITAPNVNVTGVTNITGATTVTGALTSTGILTAGNGFTGDNLTSVNVLNGIVIAGT